MSSRCLAPSMGLALVALCSVNIGCSMFQEETREIAYCGDLGENTKVWLMQEVRRDALRRGPEHNYAELFVEIASDSEAILKRCVGRREGSWAQAPLAFEFGQLEGRSDSAKGRVWIIDTHVARVIASLDRHTEAVTGIADQPPPWAELNDGVAVQRLSP